MLNSEFKFESSVKIYLEKWYFNAVLALLRPYFRIKGRKSDFEKQPFLPFWPFSSTKYGILSRIHRVVEFSRIQVPNVKTYVFLRYKFPNFNFRTWQTAYTSIYRNFHDRKIYHRDWDWKILKLFAKNPKFDEFFCQKLTFREFFSEKFVRFWLPRVVSDWWTSRSAIFGPKTI